MSNTTKHEILVVDDEAAIRRSLGLGIPVGRL